MDGYEEIWKKAWGGDNDMAQNQEFDMSSQLEITVRTGYMNLEFGGKF